MAENENIQIQKKGHKNKKAKKKHRKFWFAVKVFFLMLLLTVLAGLVVFYVKFGDDLLRWKQDAKELISESSVETFRASETSIVYASNDSMIAKLKRDNKDSYYLTFDEIPQYVKDALIVTEDRDFFDHEGVNFLSTAKAAILYVKSKLTRTRFSRGGSTITQQVAKNLFLDNSQTEERKIKEMFIAIEMEKKYSKNQILEFYINNIYFANNYYGIEAASRGYFSKPTSELTLAEAAFLCAIPNRPSTYDPLNNYSNTISRKERILSQMLDEGVITAAEYSDAKYQEIILDPADILKTQDYMTTYAVSCAAKALMEAQGFQIKTSFDSDDEQKAYEEEYDKLYNECYKSLYTGGYRIHTSLNKKKQKLLQNAVNSKLAEFKEKTKTDKIYTLQGAATCINNDTGLVVAIVGGRKQKSTVGYTLNRAFQSYRQPGSSFKPIAVYTPQLERNYTPDSIVDDSYFEGGPRNSSGTYAGKVSLRYAVEHSKNVVAWRLFEELTPKVGLSYIKKMEFSKIVDTDYVPAASLGGLTNGVSTTEMASAYSTLENDGVFREPTCVKKITDSEGNVIIDNTKRDRSKRIYKKNAARMMTSILTGVLKSGTAAGHALNNVACAGKTGTTSDKKDGWFCGYTPYFTTTVWVGYDAPKTLDNLYGSTYPLSIWEEFMNEIHEGLEYKDFQSYENESSGSDSGYKSYDNTNTVTQAPQETIDPDANDNITEPPVETEEPDAADTPEPVETVQPDGDDGGDGTDDVGDDDSDIDIDDDEENIE